jgi:hypothetical protein
MIEEPGDRQAQGAYCNWFLLQASNGGLLNPSSLGRMKFFALQQRATDQAA